MLNSPVMKPCRLMAYRPADRRACTLRHAF
jgi:hypothetical protein